MVKKKKIEKIIFGLWIVIMTFLCTGWKSTEEKGRYTEQEITAEDATQYIGMYPLADGGYALYAQGEPLLMVSGDGEQKKASALWRKNTNIYLEEMQAVSMEGEIVISYNPKISSEEFEETANEDYIVPKQYLFVDKSGKRHKLELSGERYDKYQMMEHMAFAPDGQLYACDALHQVFRIDTETGKVKFLYQAEDTVTEFCFLDHIMLGFTSGKVWLLDTGTDQLQEDNAILNEFVQTHQTDGKSIVACRAQGEEPILYLGCRSGIYQYVWNGSLIEQIADGQMLSFGNSFYEPQAMQVLENGRFRVFFVQNHLVEIYYDETLSAKPEHTLAIYSLKEDDRIRYAAQLFQKEHPDVLVRYETGMEGDNAVSKEDALKNLNTRILAGEGPDILVLDEMDIEQYADKGVLKNLDEFLQPYLEEEILFENIVDSMRMTEDNGVYALPMTFWVYAWSGEKSYLEDTEKLEDLVTAFETARAEHPEGAICFVRDEQELLERLLPVSIAAWKTENGLEEAKIREFFEAAKQIWNLNAQGMTQADWDEFRTYTPENGWSDVGFEDVSGVSMVLYDTQIWLNLGYLRSAYPPWGISSVYVLRNNYEAGYYAKQCDYDYGPLSGQVTGTYRGWTVTGICENAKEPGLAEEFLTLLLSEEVMNKWWIQVGIPIRRDSFDWCLDMENMEYSSYFGNTDEETKRLFHNETYWPPQEMLDVLYAMAESSSVFYQPGSALETAALEAGVRVLQGEFTPEEGAQEVVRRMRIEMEE